MIVIASMLNPLGSWKSFHSSGNLILIYFDFRQVSVGSIFSEIQSFICSQFVTFSVTSLSLRMDMGWPKLPNVSVCLFIILKLQTKRLWKNRNISSTRFFIILPNLRYTFFTIKISSLLGQFLVNFQNLTSELLKNIVVAALVKKLRRFYWC